MEKIGKSPDQYIVYIILFKKKKGKTPLLTLPSQQFFFRSVWNGNKLGGSQISQTQSLCMDSRGVIPNKLKLKKRKGVKSKITRLVSVGSVAFIAMTKLMG